MSMLPCRILTIALVLGFGLVLSACGRETKSKRSILVAVSADAEVSSRLVRLEARLFPPNSDLETAPLRVHAFVLHRDTGGDARIDLPFSFAIAQGEQKSLVLEMLGFDSFEDDASAIVEQRALVHFVPGSFMISVVLRAACLDLDPACQPTRTCRVLSDEEPAVAACQPIPEAERKPVKSGTEVFWEEPSAAVVGTATGGSSQAPVERDSDEASQPDQSERGPTQPVNAGPARPAGVLVDAGMTVEEAGRDGAHVTDAAEVMDTHDAGADGAVVADAEASVPRLPPEELPACPFEGVCPLEEFYPCVPSDDGRGYQCRGQYAAWPMPDDQPGSKVPFHYTDLPELGAVLDEVTGLMWQREPPAVYPHCSGNVGGEVGDTCTWDEAVDYCGQLQLGGKRWRLPTSIELESLLSLGAKNAMIDATHFPNTVAAGHWTYSPGRVFGSQPDTMYAVYFESAIVLPVPKSRGYRVRCVRSERTPNAPPSERLLIANLGATVRDRFTQLEWQRTPSEQALSAEEAQAYCAGLGSRVPTLKEVATLANFVQTQSSVDPEFMFSSKHVLWTTTRVAALGTTFVYASAIGGYLDDATALDGGFPIHVRCVR